jgi:hypothetical protein
MEYWSFNTALQRRPCRRRIRVLEHVSIYSPDFVESAAAVLLAAALSWSGTTHLPFALGQFAIQALVSMLCQRDFVAVFRDFNLPLEPLSNGFRQDRCCFRFAMNDVGLVWRLLESLEPT